MLATPVLVREVSHLRLPQRHGNTVDAYFYAGSKTLCLEVVLRTQFSSAFSDYRRVRTKLIPPPPVRPLDRHHVLSSWRLSMRACFWLIEMPVFCFFRGLS